jgi:hypothetical protein
MKSLSKQVIFVIVALVALAGVSAAAILGWMAGGDVEMSTSGYIALAVGVFLSLALGIGLMSLVFYSSRHGYDDRIAEESHMPKETEPPERP